MTDDPGRSSRPRAAREGDLGFIPQPMVRWLDPGPLMAREVKGAIAGLFGSQADRREIQAALTPPADLDYSGEEDVWFDYAADTGDGFRPTYTIAYLLGRNRLAVPTIDGGQVELPRGRFLVLGGDAVYPAASEGLYRDRFLGPFQGALPGTPEGEGPDLYAIPGNHDWYDGLTAFLRIFCQGRSLGGWRTRQTRSYFALRLPHGWWLWAIDISFDRFIDQPQLAFFGNLARAEVRPGDRLIMCTAKPSWVHAGITGDESYRAGMEARRNLEYFERKVIEPSGARLVLTLAGDLHHYARYANADGSRMKVTSGGGGAYLYPTHGLPERFSWPAGGVTEDYSLAATYPSRQRSKGMRKGVLRAPFLNRGFWAAAGVVHLILIWMVQFALRRPGEPVAEAFHRAGFVRLVYALFRSPASLVLALVILAVLIRFADGRGWRRLVLGGIHGLVQLAVPLLVTWGVSRLPLGGAPFMAVLLATLAVGGGLGAGLVMGVYLFLANALVGRHPNDVFAAQHIQDYKGFLRIHLDADGRLTIYPIGVDRVVRGWRHRSDAEPADPRFEPVKAIDPRLVEEPLTLG